MTLIEVVVAMLLLVIGGLAVVAVVNAGTRNSFRTEQRQVVVNRMEQELELIKQLPFDQLALPSVPVHADDPTDPNARVSGTQFDLGGGTMAPLVYNGSSLAGGGSVAGGQVATGPVPFSTGDVKGQLHRYVAWVNDLTCSEALCPGAQDLKRVVVAVRLDATAVGGDAVYQEIHTDVADPEAEPVNNPGPNEGGDDDDNAGDADYEWTFWMTDTPCSNSERQPLTGDHLTHNSLGACANGLQTGTPPGAPDLMFPEAPVLNSNFPPASQPIYDYATDVEPQGNGSADKGLQLRKPSNASNNGCATQVPTEESDPEQEVHRWLTPKIPAGISGLLLRENATLHLWTQTLNNAKESGRICIYLFRRQLNARGEPVDTPLVNLSPPLAGLTHFAYERDCSPNTDAECWPRGNFQKLEIPLRFALDAQGAAVPMLPDTRLGLAIRVDPAATSATALQFLYDHPSFDSRLTVSANQVLPF